MNMWEAIVLIVIVSAIARTIRTHYRQHGTGPRHQSLAAMQQDQTATQEAEHLRRQLAEVTARVQVLERILTEDRRAQSIAAEIDALRDR